ncbi:MAG: hypothetical protein R6U19_01310 [Bacteroidales bacterium]
MRKVYFRMIILCMMILVLSNNLFAQSKLSDITKLDTIIDLNELDPGKGRVPSFGIKFFNKENKNFLLSWKLKDNKCSGYFLDLEKNISKLFYLDFKNLELDDNHISDYYVTKDSIYILISDHIVVFLNNLEKESIEVANSYKYKGSQRNRKYEKIVSVEQGKILLACLQKKRFGCIELVLFEKPNSAGHSSGLDLIKSIKPKYGIKHFGNLSPNNYIAFDHGNKAIYILSPNYREVYVYDLNLKYSHTIPFERENWNQIPESMEQEIEDITYTISGINYLNDSIYGKCYSYNDRLYFDNGHLFISSVSTDSCYSQSYEILKYLMIQHRNDYTLA